MREIRNLVIEHAVENPDPFACLDAHGEPGWSCIEFDGTGLWCTACEAKAKFANQQEAS